MSAKKKSRHGPNVWVVRCRRGYAVRLENEERCSTGILTQREAIVIARRRARRNHSELIVQRRNGRIRFKDSHGFDAFPPRG